MTAQVTIKISPQFVETTDKTFDGQRLHSIQAAMLDYHGLREAVILSAPTGTGKSFSFPLPIIENKRRGGLSQMRGIIVSPTNALIEDMEREYERMFSELKVVILNRKQLDELNAHGLKRWDEILNLVRDNDLVITNPDLLNWAIFGGYSFSKKQPHIGRLLDKIDYIVFDEYHLYDEEQIANILSWIALKRSLLPAKSMKFIFASATPEPNLLTLLQDLDIEVQEICETITDQPTQTTRQIHGAITIIFRKVNHVNGEADADEAITHYLFSNQEQIGNYAKRGDKILALFDRMISLRKARQNIIQAFDDFVVAEESGYFTKSGTQVGLAESNIILATNKVEVGVNLNVKVCLMPPGKYFANFIQRIGRVARGNTDGIIVIFVERTEELESAIGSIPEIGYYDFITICRSVNLLNDRRFYSDRIPRFLGAYLFLIQQRTLKDYAAREVFKRNLHLDQYDGEVRLIFHLFRQIHQHIFVDLRMANESTKGYSIELKNIREWWAVFLGTFQYFRSSMPSVKFVDLDVDDGSHIQEYSLEWVLANRFITGERVTNGQRFIEVSGFRTEKSELQFVVESFPLCKLNEEHRFLSQKERWDPVGAFQKRVKLCMVEWQRRSQDDFSRAVLKLLTDISKLSMIFSQKRLLVSDIKEFSNFIE